MCIIRVVLLLVVCAVCSAQVKAQTEQFASLAVELRRFIRVGGQEPGLRAYRKS